MKEQQNQLKLEFEKRVKELKRSKIYKNGIIDIYIELAKDSNFSKLAKQQIKALNKRLQEQKKGDMT
ncbi:13971_t:CDS:2 [Gigaspora margarita]|uniref:13971_t:CDS:1 n=1 Tax=Gigaspora margarita TaxID=4874 RepID=A0ABN7UXE3_GIGMA|nr:13971_t:CDS:2 [Gigaspora margarita]